MPRKRMISPEFWSDEKIFELSMTARLLYIGIWNFANDYGVIKSNPKRIKALVFPSDNIDISVHLKELTELELIKYFDSDNYIYIPNWDKYQKFHGIHRDNQGYPESPKIENNGDDRSPKNDKNGAQVKLS